MFPCLIVIRDQSREANVCTLHAVHCLKVQEINHIELSSVSSIEGTMGEAPGLCIRGWSGPRDPVLEGNPPGHWTKMFQHHSQLYIQPGSWSRFHRPHGPVHRHGRVLQGYVGAGREGSVTWWGSALWHRHAPAATAATLWATSSLSIGSSVQKNQQQSSSQTNPGWRSPTRSQTVRCPGRSKFSDQLCRTTEKCLLLWFVLFSHCAIFRQLKICILAPF